MKVRFESDRRAQPTRDRGFGVSYAPAKRMGFRWRWYLMLLVALSPVAYLGWQLVGEQVLIKADGVLTTEPLVLTASEPGFVHAVEAKPGDQVELGAILIDLQSPLVDKEISLLTARIDQMKAQLDETSTRVEKLRADEVTMIESAIDVQKDLVKDYERVSKKGLVPLSDKVMIEGAKRDIRSDLVTAQVEYERAGTIEVSSRAASAIAEMELALGKAEVTQGLLDIRAPKDGIVNAVHVNQGEFVDEGDVLVEVSNYSEPVVNVYLRPKRMNFTQQGQGATVKLPNGKSLRATIKDPVQVVEKVPAALSGPFEGVKAAIKVVLRFDAPPDYWFEGLPVEVLFDY